MTSSTRAGLLKRGILLFWSLWISTVVVMNAGDLFKTIGVLPHDWALASGNYDAIVKVTEQYGIPRSIDLLFLLLAMAWEALAAVLFWWSYRRWRTGHPRAWRTVYLAFTVLLAVFALFILGDEVFHAYRDERDHRSIAILLLASLLTLQLLPEWTER